MHAPSDRTISTHSRGRTVGLSLLVIGAFVLAGCSSPAASTAAGATVKATLTEWAVVLDKASVPAGDIKFDVTNAGTQFAHEFVVIKTDLAPADLPAVDGKVDEEGAGIAFIGELEEIETGASGTVSFPLTAGKYVLICNIVETGGGHESHYNQGMRVAFTVN